MTEKTRFTRQHHIQIACWFVIIFLSAASKFLQAATQPNIVLILVDDLGWSDLGCYGHPYHRTPHIDRLASLGMKFTNGYSPAPICSASRASILTGKAVPRLGFEFVTKHELGSQNIDVDVPLKTPPLTLNLPLEEITIAESLQDLGYETAFSGKWHVSQHYQRRYLAWHPDFGPRKQGFEFAIEDFGDHPYAWKKKRPSDLSANEFPTDSMVEKTIDYIRSEHGKPFFLMASSFYVHTPVKNRTRWLVESYQKLVPMDSPNRKKRLEYAAFVETLDHHVGSIIQAIDDAGLAEETLIVFLSDNGGHPEFCANEPLRGSKWNLYEGGIRVPFIARWSGSIQANTISFEPVIGYDLLPTFAELAGRKSENVDGRSLLSLMGLNDNNFSSRELVWHFPYYHPESNYSKAIEEIGVNDFAISKTRPQSALRQGNYKLLKFAEDQRLELYDLSSDLSEQIDLSKKLPHITKQLNQQLESTLQRMNARRAVPHQ